MSYLSREPLRVEALIERVTSAERGGVAAFLGIVRNHHGGRGVSGLVYSAYEPMAELVCGEIVREAETRWPVRVALVHRLGELRIGETAVAIAAAGHHREEAFASCRYVIEEVKRRVPIWKLERFTDGSEAWVDPTAQETGSRTPAIGVASE